MLRQTVTALSVTLVLCVPAAQGLGDAKEKAKKDAIAKELKALEGTWEIVSLEVNGKKSDVQGSKIPRMTHRGDTFTVGHGATVDVKGTCAVDPTRTPKTMDLNSAGKEISTSSLYLYELSGDELRVCSKFSGRVRPTKFATPNGSDQVITTYRRVKLKP